MMKDMFTQKQTVETWQKLKIHETQENEEVYCANIDDEIWSLSKFTHEHLHKSSPMDDAFQIYTSRSQQ